MSPPFQGQGDAPLPCVPCISAQDLWELWPEFKEANFSKNQASKYARLLETSCLSNLRRFPKALCLCKFGEASPSEFGPES